MPAAGAIGRPAARAAPALRGDLKRNSPNAALPARVRAKNALMPAGAMTPSRLPRSLMRAQANLTPANAKALRRAATTLMRHDRRAASGMTVRAAMGKSARTRRGAIARTITATTARRAASAERAVRPHALPTRNSATSGHIRHAWAAVRSDLTHRAAIGLKENSAATTNFPVARPGIARATLAIAVRARILGAATVVLIAASRSRGQKRTQARPIMSDPTRAPRATAPEISKNEVLTSRALTSRVRIAAATSVRGFRVRARIVPRAIARFASDPSLI